MKVLVIGSGGREHALLWKLRQSPKVEKLYCAPGNAGIGEIAELVAVAPEKIAYLADFAEKERIDLTVVGPELPLTLGIVDTFSQRGLRIFGPCRAAAQLEASKIFAKRLLEENSVPTARFAVFTEAASAQRYLREHAPPFVVKADGLAGGKGVMICPDRDEAERAVQQVMVDKVFGRAGENVIIEEYLVGDEASFMVLTDGRNFLPLPSAQDHKRAYDEDEGPNTGGMGAYSPAPVITPDVERQVLDRILQPVLHGLEKKGICYRGILYIGLMLTRDGPKVLEFNARFGDPECQAVLMRLESDLVPLIEASIDGRLDQVSARWSQGAAVCVVLCSAGYPGPTKRGEEIRGLNELRNWDQGFVFHAGTATRDGRWITDGGRVLGITGRGRDISQATTETYCAVSKISWQGMHYRRDIAKRALRLHERRSQSETRRV